MTIHRSLSVLIKQMMKRFFLTVATVLSLCTLSAQDTVVAKVIAEEPSTPDLVKEKNGGKVKFKPYGFVRNYFYYDSRQNIQSVAGLYNQIPKDEAWNETHDEDLNDVSTATFLAITSRLGLDVSGVRVLNADLSAKIETDFCGFASSTTMLRIRQAYMKLKWEHHSLLAGQTWHPISGTLPDVLGLASGSPFEPFSRSPQLRYDYTVAKMRFTLATLWQLQYKSVGPNGKTEDYLNKGILPEIFVGMDYANEKGFQIGAGLDMIRLRPRTTMDCEYTTISTVPDTLFNEDNSIKEIGTRQDTTKATTKRIVKEYAFSVSPILFINYKHDLFVLNWKALFGQNTAHLNMMSGLGATAINEDGSMEYKPLRNFTTYIDLSYGKKWKVNLFGGFFKNLGMTDAVIENNKKEKLLYVNGASNIDYIWRVCPAISYNINKFTVGAEYELTTVGYGKPDEFGRVEAERDVMNNRVCVMFKFAW